MLRAILRLGLLAASLLAVGGCYLSDERVLARGEDVGIEVGKYLCRGDTTETLEVRKRTEATPAGPDVVYTVERTDYRFAAMGGGLHLVQGTETSNFSYSYADLTDRNRLRVLAQNPQNADRMREMAARHRLRTQPYVADKDRDALLIGTAEDVRAFLLAHDRSMLVDRVTCSREPSSR